MNACKCGKTKVTITKGLTGVSLELACPLCKTTAKATA